MEIVPPCRSCFPLWGIAGARGQKFVGALLQSNKVYFLKKFKIMDMVYMTRLKS